MAKPPRYTRKQLVRKTVSDLEGLLLLGRNKYHTKKGLVDHLIEKRAVDDVARKQLRCMSVNKLQGFLQRHGLDDGLGNHSEDELVDRLIQSQATYEEVTRKPLERKTVFTLQDYLRPGADVDFVKEKLVDHLIKTKAVYELTFMDQEHLFERKVASNSSVLEIILRFLDNPIELANVTIFQPNTVLSTSPAIQFRVVVPAIGYSGKEGYALLDRYCQLALDPACKLVVTARQLLFLAQANV